MKNFYHDYRNARLSIDALSVEVRKLQSELSFISPDFVFSSLNAVEAQLQAVSEQLYFLEEIEEKNNAQP